MPLSDSNFTIPRPSPEELSEIVRSAHAFIQTLREGFHVLGQPEPFGFPSGSTKAEIMAYLARLEGSLAPAYKTRDEIRTRCERQDIEDLAHCWQPKACRGLSQLVTTYEHILQSWNVTQSGDERHPLQFNLDEVNETDWPPKLHPGALDSISIAAKWIEECVAERESLENARQSDDSDSLPHSEAAPAEAAAGEKDGDKPKNKVKVPSALDVKAWQMSLLLGMKQQAIADKLKEEEKRPCTQGQVSKMITRVKKFLAAGGNLTDVFPKRSETMTYVDPHLLDMGRRRDGRATGQARRSDDDGD